MPAAAIHKVLDELAETLILADSTDLPALGSIHGLLEAVEKHAAKKKLVVVRDAANRTAKLVERIILQEVDDPAAALAVVGNVVSAFQAIFVARRPPESVTFPREIFDDGPVSLPSDAPSPPSDPVGTRNDEPVASAPAESLASDIDSEYSDAFTDAKPETPQESKVGGRKQKSPRTSKTKSAPAVAENPPEGGAAMEIPKPVREDASLLFDFINEANEHLEAADVHLLTIETTPSDMEALNAVFRSFHTIKGTAGFLELSDVLTLAHEAESLLDLARTNRLVLSGPAIDVTFDAVDALKSYIKKWLAYLKDGSTPRHDPRHAPLIERIKMAARHGQSGDEDPAPNWKLGEIMVVAGKASPEAVDEILQNQKKSDSDAGSARLGELLVKEGVPAKEVAQALRAQQAESQHANVAMKELVKVDAMRLDWIVDAIGELVIAVSMVRQSISMRGGDLGDLPRQLGHLDKITRELQEMGTSLRMVPIRPVFQKMARLARDLAKKVGKQVEFVMTGEDTELDKTVVDRISDPLVHMVRNAVDHGLEADAPTRVAHGKPAAGKVELRAFHRGGNIYIEITDDGRGLDQAAILAKARERGVIGPSDVLTEREIYNLIFQPGFSTAKEVTDVSGRGVGMDVVKRNIEGLRGTVEVRSEIGKGTVFSIVLPLTLAIIDGMVVRVGKERYILPTLSIITSLRPPRGALTTVLGRGELLTFHDELIPIARLHHVFAVDGAETNLTAGIIVIVESDGKRTGLLVDELIGQQQIVIKSLGDSMRGIPGLAGGAIMPDGRVGLILDVGGIVKATDADRARTRNRAVGDLDVTSLYDQDNIMTLEPEGASA